MIKAYISNEAEMLASQANWIEHSLFLFAKMQRIGSVVHVRIPVTVDSDLGWIASFGNAFYYHDLFEHDENWKLDSFTFQKIDEATEIRLVFKSTVQRPQLKDDYRGWNNRITDVDTEISYMHFVGPEKQNAIVALNHVSHRDFRNHVRRQGVDKQVDVRYEYAVFRNDESIEFNVRPTTPGAKAVTVVYLADKVTQL